MKKLLIIVGVVAGIAVAGILLLVGLFIGTERYMSYKMRALTTAALDPYRGKSLSAFCEKYHCKVATSYFPAADWYKDIPYDKLVAAYTEAWKREKILSYEITGAGGNSFEAGAGYGYAIVRVTLDNSMIRVFDLGKQYGPEIEHVWERLDLEPKPPQPIKH